MPIKLCQTLCCNLCGTCLYSAQASLVYRAQGLVDLAAAMSAEGKASDLNAALGISRAWSCDTLLRANSFLAQQQAQHGKQMSPEEIIRVTW